jgi:hypothetical protein
MGELNSGSLSEKIGEESLLILQDTAAAQDFATTPELA